jgi:hypothetical protein
MMNYEELYELYIDATNEVATLNDEAKALDKKLIDLVLDLGWDCQRMSGSGLSTYNDICRILNIEGYYEDFTEEESQGKVYDPPMSDTDQYLLNKEREEEHKSHDY